MPSFILYSTTLVLSILISSTYAQFLSSLPQCIQTCINNSDDESCSAADIKCLCRASSGSFLPDTIACMHSNCDGNIDSDLLLDPLQWLCQLAGAPIPNSAISKATSAVESTTATVTMTATASTSSAPLTGTGSSTKSGLSTSVSRSTGVLSGSVSSTSISRVMSTSITSTSTSTSGSSSASSTSSGEGVGGTSSSSTTQTLATSAASASTSSSRESVSRTSTAPSEDQTNSAPFKDSNSAGERNRVGYLVRLSTPFVVACLWV